jgi:hypothetical protein
MEQIIGTRCRRWLEVAMPLYSLALLLWYFRPQYWPSALGLTSSEAGAESVMPLAVWGLVGAMSGVLALSGLVVAFFLLYSPVYLIARASLLIRPGWVDRRELRFYAACFILLVFLGGVALVSPVMAASIFVLMAGCAHLIWKLVL